MTVAAPEYIQSDTNFYFNSELRRILMFFYRDSLVDMALVLNYAIDVNLMKVFYMKKMPALTENVSNTPEILLSWRREFDFGKGCTCLLIK